MPLPRGTLEMEPVRQFTGDTRLLTHSVLVELTKQRDTLVDQIATIDCTTFEEYRNRRGKIEGLDIAIHICKEIQRKLEA